MTVALCHSERLRVLQGAPQLSGEVEAGHHVRGPWTPSPTELRIGRPAFAVRPGVWLRFEAPVCRYSKISWNSLWWAFPSHTRKACERLGWVESRAAWSGPRRRSVEDQGSAKVCAHVSGVGRCAQPTVHLREAWDALRRRWTAAADSPWCGTSSWAWSASAGSDTAACSSGLLPGGDLCLAQIWRPGHIDGTEWPGCVQAARPSYAEVRF